MYCKLGQREPNESELTETLATGNDCTQIAQASHVSNPKLLRELVYVVF